jgi:hypothetical protein
LRNFVENCKTLLNTQIVQQIVYLVGRLLTILSNSTSIMDNLQITNTRGYNAFLLFKLNLIKLYLSLPKSSFSGYFVPLLRILVKDLVDGQYSTDLKYLLNKEDSILGPWRDLDSHIPSSLEQTV